MKRLSRERHVDDKPHQAYATWYSYDFFGRGLTAERNDAAMYPVVCFVLFRTIYDV